MNVTVMGLGLMGRRMAERIGQAFGAVTVWNRSPAKLEGMSFTGLHVAESVEAAVEESDFVITMLTDGAAVADLLFERGAACAMRPGCTVIDMSSVAPSQAIDHEIRLAARGIRHLDAPVSGGTAGAEDGTLAIMVGGECRAFEDALPVLRQLGRPVHLGPAGSGQVAKLANQLIVGLTIGGVSEGIALARSGGLDLEVFLGAIGNGLADGAVLRQLGPRMVRNDFEPRGRSSTHLKDIRNACRYARDNGLHLPLSEQLESLFAALIDRHGDVDHSGLILNLGRAPSIEGRLRPPRDGFGHGDGFRDDDRGVPVDEDQRGRGKP
ncbi:MAG: NAD(P)-dependent oxidoreductase [Rhizobiaceae bacterium]